MKKHLVMLHGFGTDSRVFSSIGTKLSKDYDVSMVDLPGHGQTRLRPEDYGGQAKETGSFFGFCAYSILHALEKFLKNEPYHLLGWSMGGQIALEMFKQNPKLINSLILISTTPRFIESDDFKIGMNNAVFNKFKKGLKNDKDKTLDEFYHMLFAANEDRSQYLDDLKKQIPPEKTLLDSMNSFENYDERNILPKINIPTLILAGDKDKIIDAKASMFMSQEIKGSVLRIFKGTGHAPFLTKEKEVMDELRTFLG
jgi:pimeloyl-[acyl-carrier protein] methyl ester esterase